MMTKRYSSATTLGFGLGSLATAPFWLGTFAQTGSAFDPEFLERTSLLPGRLPHLDYASGLMTILILTAAAGGLLLLIESRFSRTAASAAAALASLPLWAIVLNFARIEWLNIPLEILKNPIFAAVAGLIALVLLFLAFRKYRLLVSIACRAVQVMAVVGLIFVVNGAAAVAIVAPSLTQAIVDNRDLAEGQPATRPAAKVLWIIFDELDYQLAFERRADDLRMANVDRLSAETSFFATEAFPPGTHTSVSMPSLTTGLSISSSRQGRGGDLELTTAEGKTIAWGDTISVFDKARELGARTSIMSHQFAYYCGAFHRALSACWELDGWWQERRNVFTEIPYVLTYGLKFFPGLRGPVLRHFKPEWGRYTSFEPVNDIQVYQDHVEQRLRSGNDDFLFLHYELPHTPIVYDRRDEDYRGLLVDLSDDAYADNLALVDRFVGRIRETIEQSGEWENMAVIISSDHHLRVERPGQAADFRVPFIVKLPGQQAALRYDRRMNTRITSELIIAILAGDLRSNAELGDFMNTHAPASDKPAAPSRN